MVAEEVKKFRKALDIELKLARLEFDPSLSEDFYEGYREALEWVERCTRGFEAASECLCPSCLEMEEENEED